ncbi:MAG: hypothetical protein OER90_15935 [Gemmatimonadota bacterium]|nr:hypothetical protein [Gemmatimonadota bacterium]
MPRLSIVRSVFLASSLAYGCGGEPRADPQLGLVPPGLKPVRVEIRCANNTITVNVVPWTVRLRRGDPTEWILLPNSTPDSIVVESKAAGPPWPYPPGRRVGNRATPARADRMEPNVRPGLYRYSITGVCEYDGRADTVVIDPDMDVMN